MLSVPTASPLLPTAITMTIPSGSLPGGSRPPRIAPPQLASSAFRCILHRNSLGGRRTACPRAGADLAVRWGCRVTKDRNAAWSLSGPVCEEELGVAKKPKVCVHPRPYFSPTVPLPRALAKNQVPEGLGVPAVFPCHQSWGSGRVGPPYPPASAF